ncbi:unnamed protein product [Blepharisma stoltei]|uniref:Uncharacterized protein n=1 Tax=Blepharisma stoltei TaxID=1481888 RepID=A0AAU9K1M8_9CILI|nr:unnamed protein product [Blepharisma stoltei]
MKKELLFNEENDGEDDKVPLKIKEKNTAILEMSFIDLYRFSLWSDYILLWLGLIFTVIFSVLPLFLVIKIGDLIDAMYKNRDNFDELYEEGTSIAVVQFILGPITVIAGWVAVVSFIRLGNNTGLKWKNVYFKAIINKPIKWFDKHNPAEFGSSIDLDCNTIEQASGEKVMLLLSSIVLFIATWMVAFFINLQLTLIALIMLPIQIITAYSIDKASYQSTVIAQEKYKTAGGIAEESLEGVKTVSSCNSQDFLAKSYQKELEPLKNFTTVMGTLHGLGWSIFFLILFTFSGTIFYFGSLFFENEVDNWSDGEKCQAKHVVMIFFATSMSAFYLGTAVPLLQFIQNGKIAAGRVMKIIVKTKKYDGYRRTDDLKGEIEFKNVHFSYSSNKVLEGVSFKVQTGESLAIVGETGSGKSTIIQLIEGFYYCKIGFVLIDGINIKEFDLSSLRESIGLVSQEPILFNTTIKENIRIGKLSSSDSEIYDAAAEAEANHFIENLENAYETYVGIKGSQISGGQKQRIAIARAMIKKPKILLLDEATSALDVNTEKKIQKTFDKIMKGRTTIIVAQRLSTIKNAEKIIVLNHGKIVESGSHESLIEENGIYARLQAVQKNIEKESSYKSLKIKENKNLELKLEEGIIQQEKTSKTFARILWFAKKYWYWLILASLCAIITGILFPIFGYIFSDNVFILIEKTGSDMTDSTKTNMYYLFIEASIIIFSLTILCAALSRVTALYTYDLRYQGLKSLLNYDQKYFDKPSSNPSTLSYRLASDCEKISSIGGPILGLQSLVLTAILGGIIIASMHDIPLSILVLVLLPIVMITGGKGEFMQLKGISHSDLKNTTEIASDALTNIKTVHSFNRQEYFYREYISATEAENKRVLKSSYCNGVMFSVRYMAMYFLWGIVGWFGTYRIKEGKLEIKDMFTVFFCIMFSSWGLMIVGALAPDISGGIESAKHMFRIIDYKPEINAESEAGIFLPIFGNIIFRNVCFKYENRNNVVLNNVNFEIKVGKRVGITGTTGSGKSTIAQLIMRFYDPVSGSIEIDDRPIKDYNIAYLRDCICWVGQEPILFKGSILYNMKIAKENATLNEINEAIFKSQAINIVNKYSIDSDVGLRGNKLSGGEKQRIAIARALLRKPKILILDEATSALDSVTESNLQENLQKEKFTIVAIAHKLKTIQNYDLIILLEMGTIIEMGSHNLLMNIEDGHYKKLFQAS